MEKIINIDGKDIKFKSTGAFLLRYKAQFGRDAIKDIYKLKDSIGDNGEIANVEVLDLEVFYNLTWTLAKTANPSIDPPLEWLDSFEIFPLIDIIPEIIDLIFSSIAPKIESKKK